jgi:hypothetical protein
MWLLAFSGCNLGGPSSIKPPSIEPSTAADAAIDLYDKDGNAALSESELVPCPGLATSFADFDANADKSLSREEISDRLTEMYSKGTGLTSVGVQLTLDGRPLSGAKVRLVPEEFMGGAVKTAEGVTDRDGSASIGMSDEDLPERLRGMKMIQLGVYRVEVTHPSVKIPTKYNTQTTLGYENNWTNPDEAVVFRLRSK